MKRLASKSSLELSKALFSLLDVEQFQDVVLHCSDGRIGTNSALLAASSPFWASLLPTDRECSVHVSLPDETRQNIKQYLQSIFSYNIKYSPFDVKKTFRVDSQGKTSMLDQMAAVRPHRPVNRPPIQIVRQPTVKIARLNNETLNKFGCGDIVADESPSGAISDDENAPLRLKKCLVKQPEKTLSKRRKRKMRGEPTSMVSDDQFEHLAMTGQESDYEPPILNLNLKETCDEKRYSDVDPITNGAHSQVKINDIKEQANKDLLVKEEECDYEPPISNLNLREQHGQDSEPEFNQISNGVSSRVNKRRKKGQSKVVTHQSEEEAPIHSFAVPGPKESLLKKLSDVKENGLWWLVASSVKNEKTMKVVLDPNSHNDIHTALHFLIRFGKVDILRVMKYLNQMEARENFASIQSTFSLHKNVMNLVRDAGELDDIESEAYQKFTASPDDRIFEPSANCDVESSLESSITESKVMSEIIGSLYNTNNLGDIGNRVELVDHVPDQTFTCCYVVSTSSSLESAATNIKEVIKLGEVNSDGKAEWIDGLDGEEVIALVIKNFAPESITVGEMLKSTCGVLNGLMNKLAYDIETSFRKKRLTTGLKEGVCRGCSQKFTCVTIAQKRHFRDHLINCDARMVALSQKATRNVVLDRMKDDIEYPDEDDTSSTDKQVDDGQLVIVDRPIQVKIPSLDCVWALTETSCKLLLVAGENNVNMIHAAAHMMSSFLMVDHRRLSMKLQFGYSQDSADYLKYHRTNFRNRSDILTSRLKRPEIQKNVYERIRKMQKEGKPFIFPEVQLKFCMAKDKFSGALQLSEEFKYPPYTIDASSMPFLHKGSEQVFEIETDLNRFNNVKEIVIANWDVEASKMKVSKAFTLDDFEVRDAIDRGEKITYRSELNVIDTIDVQLSSEERKSRVDFILDTLDSLVRDSFLVRYSIMDWCPYIQSNLADGYRHISTKVVKDVDKKCVCECGLSFPIFTGYEYKHYHDHLKDYHRKEKPYFKYVCPVPVCNYWCAGEDGMQAHIDSVHGPPKVCEKCGRSFVQKCHYLKHVKICGLTFTCKICNLKLLQTQMKNHFHTKHHNRGTIACEQCGKVVMKRLLQRHIDDQHVEPSKMRFYCRPCDKGFIVQSKLERHLNTKLHQAKVAHASKL